MGFQLRSPPSDLRIETGVFMPPKDFGAANRNGRAILTKPNRSKVPPSRRGPHERLRFANDERSSRQPHKNSGQRRSREQDQPIKRVQSEESVGFPDVSQVEALSHGGDRSLRMPPNSTNVGRASGVAMISRSASASMSVDVAMNFFCDHRRHRDDANKNGVGVAACIVGLRLPNRDGDAAF